MKLSRRREGGKRSRKFRKGFLALRDFQVHVIITSLSFGPAESSELKNKLCLVCVATFRTHCFLRTKVDSIGLSEANRHDFSRRAKSSETKNYVYLAPMEKVNPIGLS